MKTNIKYNKKQINGIINKFKSMNLKPEEVTIYFDMDNTLCIFSYFGNDEIAVKNSVNKGFYRNLECFEESAYVIKKLQEYGFKVKIISSCVNTEFCRIEKIEWLEQHIPTIKKEDIILVENGTNKASVITDIHKSILVDDFYINLINWMNAGGIAIKKTFSNKKRPILQVSNLNEIFKILNDLNVLKDC